MNIWAKLKYVAVLILALGFLAGCASIPTTRLVNIPQVTEKDAVGYIYVGPFLDLRKGGKANTTILGTIRGGYGNPWARIRDNRGADEFVRDQVINAARASNIIADRKPDDIVVRKDGSRWVIENDKISNRPILTGTINSLIVETMMNRGAVVNISIELIDPSTNATMWNSTLVKNERAGMSGGVFDSTEDLKSWLAKVVQDSALELFASADFKKSIKK